MAETTTPLTLKEEERLYSQKKCFRCGKYFMEINKEKCFYHPGKWLGLEVIQGALVGWSCCRVKEYVGPRITAINPTGQGILTIVNDNALLKDGKGCEEADLHTEDPEYTKIMSNFPFDLEAAKKKYREELPQKTTPGFDSHVTPGGPEDPNFLTYTIQYGDTLVGIALRYEISASVLQRINRLSNQDISPLKTMLIPRSENSKSVTPKSVVTNRQSINEFKKKTNCSQEEANYYMDEVQNNLEEALKLWEEDKKFEKKNATHFE